MARITRMTKRRLGELLMAEGLITEDQVRAGLEEQRRSNLFLGEALVKLGFVSEEAIAHTIVQQFSLPFLSAQQYNIAPDVLNLFPERMYYEYQFIAVDKIGKVLTIIGAGLMNHDVLDELERLSGCRVCQFVSTWKDIRAALDKHAKDMRKEQTEVTDLGSMLLDIGSDGEQKAEPAAVPSGGGAEAPPKFEPIPVVTVPAAAATARVPVLPGGIKLTSTPSIPAVVTPGSGSGPAVAAPAARTSGNHAAVSTPGTGGIGMRPAATSVVPGLPKPPSNGLPAGPRLNTGTVGIRPPSNGQPVVPGKTAAPNAAPPGATTPPPPKSGGGLLGLFKKS